jgi:hypothetical protein
VLQLEAIAREMGLQQMGLHVFAHNPGASALYESLGYVVTSLNMLKPLDMSGVIRISLRHTWILTNVLFPHHFSHKLQ